VQNALSVPILNGFPRVEVSYKRPTISFEFEKRENIIENTPLLLFTTRKSIFKRFRDTIIFQIIFEIIFQVT